MNDSHENRLGIFLALALLMAATRFNHVGSPISLPDASWAVFFIGGFYLTHRWKWALPVLLLEAVVIDWIAIKLMGVSNYCVTVAYWFIVPSYGALWLGGLWLRHRYSPSLSGFGLLLASLFVSVNLCYLISNGSFYWLGGKVNPSFAGWMENFGDWYLAFLKAPFSYVGTAALFHLFVPQLRRNLAGEVALGRGH